MTAEDVNEDAAVPLPVIDNEPAPLVVNHHDDGDTVRKQAERALESLQAVDTKGVSITHAAVIKRLKKTATELLKALDDILPI